MGKNKNLVIAFIIAALVVVGIIYYSYSKNGEVLMNGNGEPSEQEQGDDNNFKGPTGEPYIKGPGELPPTSE